MLQHEYDTMRRVEDTYWWYQVLRAAVMSDLFQRFGAGARPRILDAGCGTGGMLHVLRTAHPDWETAGIDVSPLAVEHCRRRGFAQVIEGSVDKIPFPDASFDVVLSLDVLYHRDVSEERAASEIARVVKKKGYSILNLQAFNILRGRHDVAVHAARRYTIGRVCELLESVYLKIETIFYWNAWLFLPLLGWRLLSRLDKRQDEVGVKGDLVQPGPGINAVLHRLGKLDFAVCRTLHPPFGTSIYTVARRP
jgi:SAM-dependent methyltransferase